MKYKVSVTQKMKYSDTITGDFTSLAVAQQFIETVIKHFEQVEISIYVVMDEKEVEDDAANV